MPKKSIACWRPYFLRSQVASGAMYTEASPKPLTTRPAIRPSSAGGNHLRAGGVADGVAEADAGAGEHAEAEDPRHVVGGLGDPEEAGPDKQPAHQRGDAGPTLSWHLPATIIAKAKTRQHTA